MTFWVTFDEEAGTGIGTLGFSSKGSATEDGRG